MWQNRIIATGEVDPEQLLANPLNFRIHPRDQQEALEAVLDEVGWVQDVIVNSKTNTLIDGHLRVKLALRKGETSIPVKYVDLTEQEEVQILAAFDPVAAMAATDKEKLAALFAEIDTDNEAMNEFLQGLAEREGIADVSEESWKDAFEKLPDGERAPFQQMTFTLHDDQVLIIRRAMDEAKKLGTFIDTQNENSNGNALARACELFIGSLDVG